MIRCAAILLGAAALACGGGAGAQPAAPSLSEQARATLQMNGFVRVHRAVAKASGFSGEIGVTFYNRDSQGTAHAPVLVSAQAADGTPRQAGGLWRWASVTKQVTAVLVMQEVAAGRIDLDKPLSTYLPAFASANARSMTVRQLLRHQSGLPNPDDTEAGGDGVPAFYRPGAAEGADPLAFCAGPAKGPVGGEWSYNNCDYIVAGALLEAVTGTPWRDLVRERIGTRVGLATLGVYPSTLPTAGGFADGKPEPAYDLARYGAAGALYGSVADLLRFDVALLTGDLLPGTARAEMWDGRPELGYLALGQWSFTAPLKGCAAPVRIVERRGAIGGVQVRNFILPEQALALALFADQAEFDFGEIWQGKGFSHDMLSLAACPQERT